MSEMLVPARHEATPSGFQVVAPRVGDAMSGALRAAFGGTRELPGDMADLLAALNNVERAH